MSNPETKIAILENKLSMYEKMIEKLDSAIEKISESNLTVSRMLTIHDQKIETTLKNDEFIVEMVKKIEVSTSSSDTAMNQKIKDVETRVDELYKFKWMALGFVALVAFIVTNLSQLASGWLQNQVRNDRIELPTKSGT